MPIRINKAGVFKGHSGAIYALDQSLWEETLFSGSGDHFVALWNLKTLGAENFAAKFPAIIYAICHFSEKSLLFVGTSSGSIHVLDLKTKQEIKILQHHTAPVFDIRYSLSTNCFYSVGGDGNFAVCSLDSLSLLKTKKLCSEKVRSIDFNHFSSEIAIASGDCMIRIFDMDTLDEKKSFVGHSLSANCVAYSPDGAVLLSGGRDAHLNSWNTADYSLMKSIPAHNFAIYDIAYSPDATLFATASRDKTLKIWDAGSMNLLARINKENYDGHTNSVNKLFWSRYNNYLISTGDDRTIMIWDINEET